MIEIKFAETETEIQACYPVMSELRPNIASEDFLPQVKRQMENHGFRLVYLSDGEIKAVAGIRIGEWLAGGKYLEIEDLVAVSGERSKGYGGRVFDWVVEYAKNQSCRQIKLVSNVTRFAAHRFYLNKKMNIEAHYFSRNIIFETET